MSYQRCETCGLWGAPKPRCLCPPVRRWTVLPRDPLNSRDELLSSLVRSLRAHASGRIRISSDRAADLSEIIEDWVEEQPWRVPVAEALSESLERKRVRYVRRVGLY